MAKRPMYHVIMKDLAQDNKDLWTSEFRAEIKQYLTGWFTDICAKSKDFKDATAECWWSSNKLLVEDDELVVYFLPSSKKSLIKSQGGTMPHGDHGGATAIVGGKMISEVYILDNTDGGYRDRRHGKLLAVIAFHELLHNKLDADTNKPGKIDNKVVTDVHSLGGAAKARISAGDDPTPNNIKAMSQNLSLEHPQYTGHLFSKAFEFK